MEKEIFKGIPGFEDYAVSDLGQVISYKFGKQRLLKSRTAGDGYRRVVLYKNGIIDNRKISELVLTTFVGLRPEKMTVSHLNNNKIDDRLKNLKWETFLQNMRRRISMDQKGEKNANAKLTEKDIIQIKILLKQAYTQGYIAGMFNVNQSYISQIKRGLRWPHINI